MFECFESKLLTFSCGGGWVIISKSCLVCCILNVRVDKVKKISDFLILLWFLYNRFIYQVEMKRNIDLIGTFSFFGTTRNRCERGTPCIFICTFICICICICSICRTNIFVRYSKLRRGEVGTLCINSFIKFRRFSSPLSLSWKIPETKCFEQFTTKRFLLLIL